MENLRDMKEYLQPMLTGWHSIVTESWVTKFFQPFNSTNAQVVVFAKITVVWNLLSPTDLFFVRFTWNFLCMCSTISAHVEEVSGKSDKD